MDESNVVLPQEDQKEFNRNKFLFSFGGIGRDFVYQLVATFYISYIQFVVGLTAAQFATIGVLMVVIRIFDALNDPIMGAVIEGTHMKFGKFKPWIFIGAVASAIVLFLMYWNTFTGWSFVWFFGFLSLLWSVAFTINDVSYWCMLPSISTNRVNRDKVSTMTVVFASVGAILANLAVMFFTVGNAKAAYPMLALVGAIGIIAFQSITAFGVKENKAIVSQHQDKISLKEMFKTIFRNDQLLWMVLIFLFYNIGSGLLVALGYNYMYLTFGYDGFYGTIFVGIFAITNIVSQSFYPAIAKKFRRKQIVIFSVGLAIFGYLLLGIFGTNLIVMYLAGACAFVGQGIFYMTLILGITNCIEYNEYKFGERKEAVVFSLRSVMAVLCSALQQGLVILILIVSGVLALSNSVSTLETQKKYFSDLELQNQQEYLEIVNDKDYTQAVIDNKDSKFSAEDQQWLDDHKIVLTVQELDALRDAYVFRVTTGTDENDYDKVGKLGEIDNLAVNGKYILVIANNEKIEISSVDENFKNASSNGERMWIRMSISVLPAVLLAIAALIMNKKYKISEEYYDMMLTEIAKRKLEQPVEEEVK